MDGNELAHALGRGCTRVGGRLDGAHVPADHHGHQTAAHMDLADEGDVGGLDHGVGRLDGRDETLGLDHAQCLLSCHISFLLKISRTYAFWRRAMMARTISSTSAVLKSPPRTRQMPSEQSGTLARMSSSSLSP